ncbi:MAG: O-antigen ligase family protein, partial [Candidatus Latescibacterota bacterium]|nr:O-antigen ligase family protein [Candidatus Latescibacterota bacterium]
MLVPLIYNPLGGAFLPVKRIILYGMVAALGVAWMLLLRKSDRRWRTTPGMLLGLTYTTVALASVFWSTNRFSALVEATQLIALLTLFVFTLNNFDIHDFSIITRYVAAAGGLVAVVGILQYFGLDIAILDTAGLRHLRIPSAGLPSGTFSFRNATASFLIGSLPLALLAWHTDPNHKRRNIWFATTIAMAMLLIFTRTRGAWLGIVAGTMVSTLYLITKKQSPFATIRRKPIQAIAVIFGFLVVIQLSPKKERSPQPFDVVKDSATTALTSILGPDADRGRFTFWGNTLQMISDHPILGVGFGNWEYHYPSYDRHRKWHPSNSEPVRPHNDVLWIWSELGSIGLFGFLGFVGLTLFQSFKSGSGHKEDAY